MRMPSDETQAAVVEAELSKQLFRLTLADGTTITAGLCAEAKRLGVPIHAGMRVQVQRARLDPARGTILGPLGHGTSEPSILDPTSIPRKRS